VAGVAAWRISITGLFAEGELALTGSRWHTPRR